MRPLPEPFSRYRYRLKNGVLTLRGIRVKELGKTGDANGRISYCLYDHDKNSYSLYEGHVAYGIKVGNFDFLSEISRSNKQIDHIDRDIHNNALDNICLVNRQVQSRNRGDAVLDRGLIRRIFSFDALGLSHRKIGVRLNVAAGTVYDVLKRGTHSDITGKQPRQRR